MESKLFTIQEEHEQGKRRLELELSEARKNTLFNSGDTILRDIKKGHCPLPVPDSVDINVRQINDIIKLKTALPALGAKFDFDPKKPDTTKFLNFLHTLNDKMSTVPMSGPTYNILVHSMLGTKANAKLGRLSLSTMPCKKFLDVCCGSLGTIKTQDKKRQDFFSLTPQGPDPLTWWTTISNEGTDSGCGIQAIWERFLEYVPNADARFLRWELNNHFKETGHFPTDGQAFILETLNDSLGKCKIIFDQKKATTPKIYNVREDKIQEGTMGKVFHPKTQAQCTVGYAGQPQNQFQKNGTQGPLCRSCNRGRDDAKGCIANFHRPQLCYICNQKRDAPTPGCRSNFHLTRPKQQEKQFCRLCGNNSHWSVDCFIYAGELTFSAPCSVCKNMYGRTLFHKEEVCKERKGMVESTIAKYD